MLTINKISKNFGIKPVLSEVSFQLNAGEKLGLIGLNGCGKTTLLEIITGGMKADSGSVCFAPPDLRIGYLRQGLALPPDETISGYLNQLHGDVHALSEEVARLSGELVKRPDDRQLMDAYDHTLTRLQAAGESAGGTQQVLAMLGLGDVPADWPIRLLSGGQKTRLGLASVLVARPQLLLLDEPTNHLDIEMLEWLEGWLKQSRSAALIVSHDRTFLDRVVTGILELDEKSHSIRQFAGSYSDYAAVKKEEREKQWQDYADQQDEIKRLSRAAVRVRDLANYHKGGKTDQGRADGFMIGFFANRGKETTRRAKTMEKRIEHLLTDERIDKPARTWHLKVDFESMPESGRDVVVMQDLSIGYGEAILCGALNMTIRYGERIVLTGANGCGKSTLLKTIIGIVPAISGAVRLGSGVKYGYLAQEQETLDENLSVFETMQSISDQNETDTRAFLSKYLFTGDQVFSRVGSLSYGEKVRLMLACLVAQGCNLLILDEPVNHLDIPSRERFEETLAGFQGTILAVVHDRTFIKNFGQVVWKIVDQKIIATDNRY